MPRALLLQQVFEAAGGLLRVLLCRALDSRDSVVWLALAVGARVVVVVVTALVPVVATAAARVLFALAADGVVLGVGLVFFISPGRDRILEVGDGAWAATAEVFESATVVESVLEEVDDFFVRDIDYCGALVEETAYVLAKVLTDKRRIPLRSASVRTPHLFHHEIPKVLVNPRSKGITSVRSTFTL
jgi:hypothetical protein